MGVMPGSSKLRVSMGPAVRQQIQCYSLLHVIHSLASKGELTT